MEIKTLEECPVCHSKDLEQEYKYTTVGNPHRECGPGFKTITTKWPNGSHCNSCGVKLHFNTKGVKTK